MYGALRSSFMVFLSLTLITGVAYPGMVTLVGHAFFPHQSNGSLIERQVGTPGYRRASGDFANRYFWLRADIGHESETRKLLVGSELIGQPFAGPRYFWGRPSAASYNGGASTGSNLGPTNPAQLEAVKQRVADLKAAHEDNETPVPVDLVTASASGLDPHISPGAANYQIARVSQARNLEEQQVRELVAAHIEGRTLGLLGEPRVNVLKLNLALDGLTP